MFSEKLREELQNYLVEHGEAKLLQELADEFEAGKIGPGALDEYRAEVGALVRGIAPIVDALQYERPAEHELGLHARGMVRVLDGLMRKYVLAEGRK